MSATEVLREHKLKLRPIGHTREGKITSLFDSLADQLCFRLNPLFTKPAKGWYAGMPSLGLLPSQPATQLGLLLAFRVGGREAASESLRNSVSVWLGVHSDKLYELCSMSEEQRKIFQDTKTDQKLEDYVSVCAAVATLYSCRVVVIDQSGYPYQTLVEQKNEPLVVFWNGVFYSSCIPDFASVSDRLIPSPPLPQSR